MELIKCICIQHFNSFFIYQTKTNEMQKKKKYYGKINFDSSVVFASSLLFPLKDGILDNASEKMQPDPHVFYFKSRVHVI